MTSVDSGIETSNNSDDSSFAQNEDMLTDEINTSPVSSAVATISSTQNDIRTTKPENLRIEIGSDWLVCWPGVRLPLSSLGSINENYKYPEEIENSTPTSSSGPIVLSSNVPEIKFPCIYNSARPSPYMTIFRRRGIYYKKMKSVHTSHRYHHPVSWSYSQAPFIERKMRVAAATNNTIMMRQLLISGVSPNNHDEQGRTPLHLASCRGYTEMNCKGENMQRTREEVQNVKSMLLACLRKQKDTHKKMDTLSTFCSRLSLSNPSDQIQDDVKDLLANLDALSITQ
ncbi:uncharacterized protein LOC117600316 isoform X2 [Osmia lignaria lignaria]|uniref:uncharacterized protein LOC114883241 isoform X2 n=1 Tax=Osmia bicornis bicornis TaxID=1437191 RepID=UPI0010F8BBAD|nr:uncharacterized protein LOC114883241 isoform X2 [Osmia bicornis bicornis]XP_034171500.1 uncharacterized protein LOC117600316 isoform X2 [Osmia lignaria]